jgi:hypothetical protein
VPAVAPRGTATGAAPAVNARPTPSSPLALPPPRTPVAGTPAAGTPAVPRRTPAVPLALPPPRREPQAPVGEAINGVAARAPTLPPGERPRSSLGRFLILSGVVASAVAALVHFLVVPLPVLAVWRAPARLDVRTDPSGAEVYLDGRRLSARTPTYTEVRRDRMVHALELHKDGFRPVRQLVRYDRSARIMVAVPMELNARPRVEPLQHPAPAAAAAPPSAAPAASADAGR